MESEGKFARMDLSMKANSKMVCIMDTKDSVRPNTTLRASTRDRQKYPTNFTTRKGSLLVSRRKEANMSESHSIHENTYHL